MSPSRIFNPETASCLFRRSYYAVQDNEPATATETAPHQLSAPMETADTGARRKLYPAQQGAWTKGVLRIGHGRTGRNGADQSAGFVVRPHPPTRRETGFLILVTDFSSAIFSFFTLYMYSVVLLTAFSGTGQVCKVCRFFPRFGVGLAFDSRRPFFPPLSLYLVPLSLFQSAFFPPLVWLVSSKRWEGSQGT